MTPPVHSDRFAERWMPYAMAVFAGLASLGLDLALWPVLRIVPLSVPLVAIMLSAWYGGLGPGAVTAAITFLGVAFLLFEPKYALWVHEPEDIVRLLVYGILAAIVAVVAARLRSSRRAALTARHRFADLVDGIRGGIVWEADTPSLRVSFVSAHADRLSGYSLEEWRAQDAFLLEHAHPDDRHTIESAIGSAITAGGEHTCEHRFLAKDGHVIWLSTRLRRAFGPDGATVLRGLSVDVTKMKETEAARFAAERARVESEERLRLVVERLEEHAIVMLDAAGRVMSWNAGAERALGYAIDEILAEDCARFYPAEDVARGKPAQDLAAAEASGTLHDEALRVRRDGSEFWAETTLTPVRDDHGRLRGFALVMRDISARRRAEDARRFLSDAVTLLTSSLDYDETLAHIAALAVPRIGDWCTIDLVEPDGSLRRVGSAHVDPSKVELVRTLERRFPYQSVPQGIRHVVETSGVEHYSHVTAETLSRSDLSREHVRALLELGISSLIIVPLVGRGAPLGAITLVSVAPEHQYDAADVQLARDLGQRAGMAVENARLYHSAQRAIAIRDEFLSIASHELKTPITALRLQLHTILRGAQRPPEAAMPAERVARAVETASRQTERLAKLVDGLLDVSRISAGKLELEPEPVDLGAAVQESVQRFAPEIAAAGCTVEVRVAPGVVGRWDRMRVDQIVTNLLSNAVKYGAGKPIEIEVAGDEQVARLRVRDHGIGIPPEKLPRIFERFERGVSSREFGGLGLGLYIVRQLVEAHGGRVRAESPGDGAVFEVELPRAREPRATAAGAAA